MADGTLASAQKKADAEGRLIVWVDEAGFSLLPGCVRTYAPRGQTPVLRVKLTRDHLSVIGAVTATGRVLLQVQREAFAGPTIVRFLKHLLHHLPGKLLVIWGGLPAHRGQAVRTFLASKEAAGRLWLERLPSYAILLPLGCKPHLSPAVPEREVADDR